MCSGCQYHAGGISPSLHVFFLAARALVSCRSSLWSVSVIHTNTISPVVRTLSTQRSDQLYCITLIWIISDVFLLAITEIWWHNSKDRTVILSVFHFCGLWVIHTLFLYIMESSPYGFSFIVYANRYVPLRSFPRNFHSRNIFSSVNLPKRLEEFRILLEM